MSFDRKHISTYSKKHTLIINWKGFCVGLMQKNRVMNMWYFDSENFKKIYVGKVVHFVNNKLYSRTKYDLEQQFCFSKSCQTRQCMLQSAFNFILISNRFKVYDKFHKDCCLVSHIRTFKSRDGSRHHLVEDVVGTLKRLLGDDTSLLQQVWR